MSRRVGSVLAIIVLAIGVGVEVLLVAIEGLGPGEFGGAPTAVEMVPGLLGFSAVGALLLYRRPEHRLGWVLGGFGAATSLATGATSFVMWWLPRGGNPDVGVVLHTLGTVTFEFAIVLGLVLLPVLFPSGAAPTPRWGFVLRVVIGASIVGSINQMFLANALDLEGGRYRNPLGIESWHGPMELVSLVLFVSTFLLLVPAVISLVRRYWRSTGQERQQMKWFVLSMLLFGVTLALLQGWVGLSMTGLLPDPGELVSDVVLLVPITAVPLSIGAAVLRYRLYDIDRVISRTLAYAALTSALVGIYALGVLGVGALVPGEPNDLLVAGSTLVVAALFRPLRSRIQNAVDRRFNRARYDAAQVVEAFGWRLRDEVDVDALAADLRQTVGGAFSPRAMTIWTKAPG